MSGSKDAFAGRGRGAWERVTRAFRCPICSSNSWCQVSKDGGAVICMRDSTGIEKTDAAGQTFYVHHISDSYTPREVGPEASHGVERAPLTVLDEAYRTILAALRLTDGHRANLRARGLTDDEIGWRSYRSLPLEGRSAIAKAAVQRVGEASARGVPGVAVVVDGDRSWWTLGGSPGLVVPVRDVDGAITALKIRRDEDGGGGRYTYVSSASKGGAGALLAVHVPTLGDSADCSDVRVTEGELKADVATSLSGIPTISIPGVGAWRSARPVLERLGAKRVRIALDADHTTNPNVGIALAGLVRDLVGLDVAVERWDARFGKGVDDALQSGCAIVCDADAAGYAGWVAGVASEIRRAREAMRGAA